MSELHTPDPWESQESTEDFQGHFITGGGRTVAATYTEDACDITAEDVANASLMVAAPAMLKVLRQIACDVDFTPEDGAMELGQRLIEIVRTTKDAIALYETPFANGSPSDEEDADE